METCGRDQTLSEHLEWLDPRQEDRAERDARRQSWYEARPTLALRRIAHAAPTDLGTRFNALQIAWHQEYGPSSSFTEITRCPSYRKIVNLGKQVLPLIFRDLQRRPEPDHWFDALVEITKVDPVRPKDRGYSRRMAKVWLKWARIHGYV